MPVPIYFVQNILALGSVRHVSLSYHFLEEPGVAGKLLQRLYERSRVQCKPQKIRPHLQFIFKQTFNSSSNHFPSLFQYSLPILRCFRRAPRLQLMMHNLIKALLLAFALTFTTWTPTVDAFIPLVDRAHGVLQQRPYCPPRPASPEFQRAALYEFLSEYFFETGGIVSAFNNFLDINYIQHSPNLPPRGRNATLASILSAGNSFAGVNITILKVMFDSPYGMVHYKFQVPGTQPLAFVDMWRFDGTCIVEHWDVIEALSVNATNPIALF